MGILLKQLLKSESGGTAIEYGMIGLLISVSFIGAAMFLGNEVGELFNDVGSEVDSAH